MKKKIKFIIEGKEITEIDVDKIHYDQDTKRIIIESGALSDPKIIDYFIDIKEENNKSWSIRCINQEPSFEFTGSTIPTLNLPLFISSLIKEMEKCSKNIKEFIDKLPKI